MPTKVSAKEAILSIQPGKRIFLGSGSSVPTILVKALAKENAHFQNNQVFNIFTLGCADYVKEELKDKLRSVNFFIGENVRKAVNEGFADYIPIFLSEIPSLLRSPSFDLDTALVTVSPPDKNGMCSLGVSVDITRAAVDNAKRVIAVINPNMPRTFGQSFIAYNKLDLVVEDNSEIPELATTEPDSINTKIGEYIADLIEDSSVLQMGIGAIPDAVLKNIFHKKNLGIHTEMFSDGVIDLMLNGVVTNESKKILKGRTLTSFIRGSRRLYDFVHENPLVEFYPSDFANDPYIISQNDKVIAINSALQVDLTGQICADSIGKRFYSGIGGQVDFMRAAARSKGGKPIIALPSTAKNGSISRIVPELFSGAGVVTSRGDAHYIVTEYGVAYLHGKTIRERAVELISIAHPDFRADLLNFVKQTKYVAFDQHILDKESHYPQEMEEFFETNGQKYKIRPIKPADERLFHEFFHKQDKDIQKNYLSSQKLSEANLEDPFLKPDYHQIMGLAIFEPGEFRAKILGVAYYEANKGDTFAHFRVVIDKNHQKQGLAKELSTRLINYAKDQGYQGVYGFIKEKNQAAKELFRISCPKQATLSLKPENERTLIKIDFMGETHE